MLKNLKIFHKVTLLSVILLIFTCIVGFTGYSFTKNSNENLSTMYNSDMKAINILDDIRIQARTCQYDLVNLIMYKGDTDNQAAYLKEMNEKIDGITNAIAKYKALDLTDDEKDDINKLESNLPQYKSLCYKIKDMAYSENIKTQEITSFMAENKDLLDVFRSSANALLKSNIQNADDIYTKTQSANAQSIKTLSIIIILSIILGIIITYLIVKPITSALSIATNYLGILATGDFTSNISPKLLNTKDEIGQMLKAVDKMQKSIKELLSSVINESSNIVNMIGTTNSNIERLSNEMQDVSSTTEELSAGMQETAASTEKNEFCFNRNTGYCQNNCYKGN